MNPLMLLQALRAHAAGAGAPGQPQPGLGGGAPPQPQPGQGGGNFTAIVAQMIDLGTQAMRSAPDPVDAEGMAKIVATLHSFEAAAAKDRDAAMGVSPAIRAMRRGNAQG